MPDYISQIDFGDGVVRTIKDPNASGGGITSISVNGVSQTITSGAVDLDIETNLIKDATWTSLQTLWATS